MTPKELFADIILFVSTLTPDVCTEKDLLTLIRVLALYRDNQTPTVIISGGQE